MGSDDFLLAKAYDTDNISIHAPRMGSDQQKKRKKRKKERFQSTLPAWGATKHCLIFEKQQIISIHAPRMGSDLFELKSVGGTVDISIHAPRMGSDTVSFSGWWLLLSISIHAPRMGSDLYRFQDGGYYYQFQSTLPAWGATFISHDVSPP